MSADDLTERLARAIFKHSTPAETGGYTRGMRAIHWGYQTRATQQRCERLAADLLPIVAAEVAAAEKRGAKALAICDRPHGGPGNAATVYGHHSSVRVCIRLYGGDVWLYDPRWERRA